MSAIYPQAPREVWRALSDRDALATWLMPNDFEPRVGHRFCFRTDPAPGFDGIVRCEVLELVFERRLSISWVGGGNDTIVTFELTSAGTGTRMTLTHTGFKGIKGRLIGALLANGWRTMLDRRLPQVLHRGAAGEALGGCEHDASLFWRLLNALRR